MTARRPQIVVSLPGRTVDELRLQAAEARAAGADIAEIRIDRLDPPDPSVLRALFPSPVPLLATYRSRAEGGGGSDDPDERRAVLTALARMPFRWIDLEIRRDRATLETLASDASPGRIASRHPGPGETERWAEYLRELDGVPAIGKLVVPASITELTGTLLPMIGRLEAGSAVVHTTGPSGPLLRSLAQRLGFPMVFASLPEAAGRAPVEPSQIPVDRLGPFLGAEPTGPTFAVVGHPIDHSRSPALHTRWMRDAGRSGLYLAIDPGSETEFVELVGTMDRLGLRGLNVTQPYKRAAFEAMDTVGPGAEACGVVNCVRREEDGTTGENFDLVAVLRRMESLRASGAWSGGRVVVVGSGGAARASLAAANALRAPATVLGRSSAAATVAREFGAEVATSTSAHAASLLVHATPVGWAGTGELGVDLGPWIGPGTYVLDWVYAPERPIVRTIVERRGARYEDGWRLFVRQAAASFAYWWGEEPPADSVRRAEDGTWAA